jgi:hypothetical protein
MFRFVTIACFFLLASSTSSSNYQEVRLLFKKATGNKDACEKLITITKTQSIQTDIILTGYKACALMVNAKYVSNPFSKLETFSNGKNLLEKCLVKEPENVELHFLRYTIQTNIPSFLNYSGNIYHDKYFILKRIDKSPADLREYMIPLLKSSPYLTDSEKNNLK